MRRWARGLSLLLTLATAACTGSRPQRDDAATCVGPNPATLCASASRPCVPSGCGCSFGVWTCTGDCRSDADCTDSGTPSRDADGAAADTAAVVDGAGCTPGLDQTCIDNPFSSIINGHCLADRTCVCDPGFALNPATGLCR